MILLLEPKVQRKVHIVSNGKLREGLYNYIGISGLECSGPLHIVAFEEAKVLAKLRSTNLRSDLLLAQMFDDLVAFFTFHTPYTVLRTLTKIVTY